MGSEYENTRHNIGFNIVDSLLRGSTIFFKDTLCESQVFATTLGSEKVLLVKPNTYVNRSGDALKGLCDQFELSSKECVVIVDDFHLDIGRLRFRSGGSHGGHNGLRSIIDNIGKDFPRLRVGIGPKDENTNIIDFVLGHFTAEDSEKVEQSCVRAKEALLYYVAHGVEATMNEFNSK